MAPRVDAIDGAIAAVVIAHVLIAPYTKIEETFPIQALHGALAHGLDIDAYDHHVFPCPVPRTSIASFALAMASAPWIAIARGALGTMTTGHVEQVVCRMTLGCAWVASHASLRRSISDVFGATTSAFTGILALCEFHLLFYASRPLMNVFAMVLTMTGVGAWARATATRDSRLTFRAVRLVTVAAFLLRCDVLLLLGGMGLHMLATGLISVPRAVWVGGTCAALTIAASVLVDSWFYRYWVWPEFSGFYFSAVLNKSIEWGTSPWHWYFTVALPKSLMCAYPLAMASVFVERRARPLMFVGLFYVALISILEHKELRFIFPVLPLFNVSAATVLARIWNGRSKPGAGRKFVTLAAFGMLCASAALVCVFTAASAVNYPGGVAFSRLHHDRTIAPVPGVVHIDVPAKMTGVSLFGEAPPGSGWTYAKKEELPIEAFESMDVDYLVNAYDYVPGYEAVHVVNGYGGLNLRAKSPLELIKTKPEIYIHRKKRVTEV